MEYTRLGKTGMKVSRLCLGMMSYGSTEWRDWILDEETCHQHVKRALELGINFFDTANVYSQGVSETYTGSALKKYAKRENVILATKVNGRMSDDVNAAGLSRKHILDQVDASLKRLQTDYIDLYQIHRWDYNVPIEETLEALHDCVRAGKVRYIGASSMFAWQFTKSLYLADLKGWSRFVSMQNHYNLIYREEEREMLPLCADEGIGVIPWSPLARGMLTRPAKREADAETLRSQSDGFRKRLYTEESDLDVVDAVGKVADDRGISRAQVALAWLLSKPVVTSPIIGSTKLAHLEDAIKAVEVKLSDEEIATLEAPYLPHTIRGHQ